VARPADPPRRRWLRWVLLTVGAALAFLAVLAAEVAVLLGREYPDQDVGYLVDTTVRPRQPAGDGEVVDLVMIGDSTVAGVGAPTPPGSLPVQTAQRVADRLGRPVHVVGFGVSGATTEEVRRDQVARIGAADVVAVVAGSNDLTHLTPLWAIRPRTRRLLRDVHARSGAPVVLGGTPEFATLVLFPQPLRAASGWLAAQVRERQRRAVADAGPWASFVDISALASPRFLGRPESMAADRYHPSPVGYGFWADALAPAVAAAVADAAP